VPATLDPAVAYDPIPWQILTTTGDGLMGYRKVGGPAGSSLVPDLASALPEVSPDGRTYRFPLRDGIRYSTGEPVRPEDFRRGLERTIVLNEDARGQFAALRGFQACVNAKDRCDLSDSIVADAEAVTFLLTKPDPDLPAKLALTWAFPVPAATPMRDQGLEPIPSTGPYVVTGTGGGTVTLERNASFEEWSGAAQPDGVVDAISWRFDQDPSAAFGRLVEGSIDWMASEPAPEDVSRLQESSPGQIALSTALTTLFVGYDVLRPPFDDVRVRRALNLALDREKIVELAGGTDRWRLTCQILAPNLQGYQPFCPYTADPAAGVWSEPVLERAKALVRRAGARGTAVVVSTTGFLPALRLDMGVVARYVVGVMNEIGLRATVEVVSDPREYFDAIYQGAQPGSSDFPQAYLGGWSADYPRASDFIEPQFRCEAPANVSGYCNKRLDAAIDRTKTLSTTNPGAADRAWTAIEHQLVQDAVWAPLFNQVVANVFSARVGNAQINPQWGPLLTRIWVQ
jgi:peptide/nickel transport system substrate-binding protein